MSEESLSEESLSEVALPEGGLAARLAAVSGLLEVATDVGDAWLITEATTVQRQVEGRLRHGTEHTIVALAGPTGAGKSSLFNDLVGEDLAATGVTRPVTSATQAAVFGRDAPGLLDWLEVSRRHHVDAEPNGLILLDLPDHDSVATAHRSEVDRLIGRVDLFVWVTDPQKYADAALHEGYVQPLSAHGRVMQFVLSKSDTLDSDDLEACRVDFAALLRADGVDQPRVLSVSTVNDGGVDPLRESIAEAVRSREHAVGTARVELAAFADRVSDSLGLVDEPELTLDQRALHREVRTAIGADAVANGAERHVAHTTLRSLDWPPLRMIRRRSPILTEPVGEIDAAGRSRLDTVVRTHAETVAAGLPSGWRRGSVRQAIESGDDLATDLASVRRFGLQPSMTLSRAAAAIGWLQRVAFLVAMLGIVWLLALAVVDGFLRLDLDAFALDIGGVAAPTWLLLFGLVIGACASLSARLVARRAGRRARRAVDAEIDAEISRALETHLLSPAQSRRDNARLASAHLAVLRSAN